MKVDSVRVPLTEPRGRERLYRTAWVLALVTVGYNVLEGVVSVFFGFEDGTAALFGFGLDSFVEVISGVGILHMIGRLRRRGDGERDRFESAALKVTGTAFYLLTLGLAVTALLSLVKGHAPETTFWGVVVSVVSIVTMWVLIVLKTGVGKSLGSAAILADAACTRACLYLSVVLLLSSAGYALTGAGYLDSAGAALIAFFSFREGREAFAKARGEACGCRGPCGP